MPIYDYQCSACGHLAEVMRKVSAASLEACPACQQNTFCKQVSAPSFQLSGTGWYATDFKNSGAKPTTTEAKTTVTASDTATNTKAETKAAAPCQSDCACH